MDDGRDDSQDRQERRVRDGSGRDADELAVERDQRQVGSRGAGETDEVPGAATKLPLPKRIAAVASRQGGALRHRQLIDLGLSSSGIHRRVESGTLHRIHRGVYVVGHLALAPLAREWAAVLWCGERSVISHASAARVCQWTDGYAPDRVEVTVAGRQARSRRGICVHETLELAPIDVRYLGRLPVTAPVRTILDLAATDHPQLERILSEAHARRAIRRSDLTSLLERSHGRKGASVLKALIDAEQSGYTRSEAERLLRKLLREARLPQPLSNTRLEGYEVDFFWREQKLVVEVDGYAAHGHRAAFERDRRKDAALVAAGYRVIRITWRQLTDEPIAVAVDLARALSAA